MEKELKVPNYEVLLLAGAPGSGKSSIAKRVVERNRPIGVRHLSIGDLKRSITSGDTPSAFTELLLQQAHPDRKSGAAPSSAITGIIEEFIVAKPNGLTIVDGFPRYMDRVEPFKESMNRIGAIVLGLCVVEAPEDILLERLMRRPKRTGQKMTEPRERLADHIENIVPTIECVSKDYPTFTLDGTLEIETNALRLIEIYNDLKSNIS